MWVKSIIPKIGFFTYVASQNKILMMENMRIHCFSMANRCILCLCEEELVNHLLIHYEFATEPFLAVLL